MSVDHHRITLWDRDTSTILHFGPLEDLMVPRADATGPPIHDIPPLESIDLLQLFPDVTPVFGPEWASIIAVTPTGWSTSLEPPSILVECKEAVIHATLSGASIARRRYDPVVFEAVSTVVSRTVGGHPVQFSENGKATVFWGSGRVTTRKWAEIGNLGLWRRAVPFVCPFSGVVGGMSADGVVCVWKMD